MEPITDYFKIPKCTIVLFIPTSKYEMNLNCFTIKLHSCAWVCLHFPCVTRCPLQARATTSLRTTTTQMRQHAANMVSCNTLMKHFLLLNLMFFVFSTFIQIPIIYLKHSPFPDIQFYASLASDRPHLPATAPTCLPPQEYQLLPHP